MGLTCSTYRPSTIGTAFRKGRNNTTPAPDDPGSPWAIGSTEGGHKSIHPQLGTLDDFRHLYPRRDTARNRDGHCLPVLADHPYVKSGPSGSGNGPTARSSTPSPPKKCQTSILRFRDRRLAPDGTRALSSGLPRVHLPWITRTSPSPSGNDNKVKRHARRHLLVRRSRARGPTGWRREFTQSYRLPWRNTGGADAYLTELTQTEVKDCGESLFNTGHPDRVFQYGGRLRITRLCRATLGPLRHLRGLRALKTAPRAGREYLDSESTRSGVDIHRPTACVG